MIKVLVVDDSSIARNMLKAIITNMKGIEVIGEARNGQEAINMNNTLNPDIIIMDIDMPIMNGIEATKYIMKEKPKPILIFSAKLDNRYNFEAIKYGAIDVMKKPSLDVILSDQFLDLFRDKLISIASANINTKRIELKDRGSVNKNYSLILIGASTGGPKALLNLLSRLKNDVPGIVIVQHIESGFIEGFSKWLDEETMFNVRIAKNKDMPSTGEVIVAPSDIHLVFNGQEFVYDDGPKVLNQKPSIDITFSSVARYSIASNTIAILLTGMGRDGARGCLDIKSNGGYTIVEDESSATIFGMPKAAIEIGGAVDILSLENIPQRIMELVKDAEEYK